MARPIEIRMRTKAPLDRVWTAWTDPSHLAQWYPDRASGAPVEGATITYEWDALGMSLPLDVLSVEPHRRLVFAATPPGLPTQTQTIALSEAGGETEIRLEHRGFEGVDDDIRAGTAAGWTVSLAVLSHYLEHHFGEDRLSAWMLGLVPSTLENVHACFATADGMSRWLGAVDELGDVGDPYAITSDDGTSMTGRVLSRMAPRDVALSWREINGALALRVFAVAPGALLVGANMMSWNTPEADLVVSAQRLEASVNRLVRELGGHPASA